MAAIDAVRPGLPVLETSARTGAGMEEWIARLEELAAGVTAGVEVASGIGRDASPPNPRCLMGLRVAIASLLPLLAAAATHAAPPVDLQPQWELPAADGCGSATMTMRPDAEGRPFLYVAAKDAGLRVYDLAATPTLVATVAGDAVGGLDVNNLVQSGELLFLALGDVFDPNAESPGLAVLDVSDPATPKPLDLWRDDQLRGGAAVVAVEGDLAYLGAMHNGLAVFAGAKQGRLRLVSRFVPDIHFPDPHPDPHKVNARGLAVRNGVVYLAYDAGGVRIVDARHADAPREIGHYSNPALNGRPRAYNNVVLDGSRLYVSADYCGLEVLNVAKPNRIRRLSWWNPWKCPGGPFSWFGAQGHANELVYDPHCKLLFVAAGRSDLEVVSVVNPRKPTWRADYPGVDNQRGSWGVARDGDRVYVSYLCALVPYFSSWSGVAALTWSDPSCH